MRKLLLIGFLLTFCLPVLAQEVIPQAEAPTDMPLEETGLIAAITLVVTYGARRLLGDKRLEGNPAILGWISVAVTTVATAAVSIQQGMNYKEAAVAALTAWLAAQGARRAKKLVNIS